MAWSLAALCFYLLVFMAPLLEVTLYGRMRIGDMMTGVAVLDDLQFWTLATIVFLTTVLMPFVKVMGTFLVLMLMRLPKPLGWLASLYALLRKLDPWAMIEVYLLGFIIACTRLQAITYIHIAAAVIGLGGLMICMTAMDSVLDPKEVWNKIRESSKIDVSSIRSNDLITCDTCGEVSLMRASTICMRCGDALHHRKPDSLQRTWALGIAAALLYLPSNFLPVMNVTQLGRTKDYTIFAGIRELATIGLWPLAALVFIASIAIPLFKLAALVFMLVQTHRHSEAQLRLRTKLYHIIDFIGRWSMVDIFMVSILVAVVRFGWTATITPDLGIVCFAGVVVLTLFAVKTFDPRLMWDVAAPRPGVAFEGQGAHVITD